MPVEPILDRTPGVAPASVRLVSSDPGHGTTLEPLRFFLYKRGPHWQCYTLDQLRGRQVRTGKTLAEGVPEVVELRTEEDVSAWKPEGRWEVITLIPEWLGVHNEKVEAAITEIGTGLRDGMRWRGAVIGFAVERWTLTDHDPRWTPTEAGYRQLPLELWGFVGALVCDRLYGGLGEDPDFFVP